MLNFNLGVHISDVVKLKIRIFNEFATITKTIGVLMIVLCLLCVVEVREGVAQEAVQGDAKDPIQEYKKDNGKLWGSIRSVFGFGNKFSNKSLGVGAGISRGPLFSAPGDEKIEGDPLESQGPYKIKPKERKQDFHTYIPKRQFNRMIDSKEWEKMYDEAVSGGNGSSGATAMIGAVTWGLANSAVGQARYQAISQTHEALMNHYLAEIAFLKQVEQNPQMSQSITDAYFTCVRDKMQQGGDGKGSGETSKDSITWFEAQEICMGDKSDISGNDAKKPELFNYENSYDYYSSNGDSGKKICLTDYLFHQESDEGSSSTSRSDIQDFKKAYQNFIGDILFQIIEDNGGGGASGVSGTDVIGIRKINYKFLYPGDKDSSNECGIEKSDNTAPYELLKKMTAHRYSILMKVLEAYCKRRTGAADESDISKFWKQQEEFFAYYNVQGFQMDVQTVQNLYDLYADVAKKKDGVVDCNGLSSDGVEDDIIKYASLSDTESGAGAESVSNSYKLVYYMFARSVSAITVATTYDILSTLMLATTTNALGYNSDIVNMAENQINQVVRKAFSIDRQAGYSITQNVLAALAVQLEDLNAITGSKIKGFTVLRGALGMLNDKSGANVFNPQNN